MVGTKYGLTRLSEPDATCAPAATMLESEPMPVPRLAPTRLGGGGGVVVVVEGRACLYTADGLVATAELKGVPRPLALLCGSGERHLQRAERRCQTFQSPLVSPHRA